LNQAKGYQISIIKKERNNDSVSTMPPQTYSLRTEDVATVADASYKFGKHTALMSARPGRGWPPILKYFKFWFTVPEGFYALVTRHGALCFVIVIYV